MFHRKNIVLWLSVFWNIPAFLLALAFGQNYVLALAIFALPALYYSWVKRAMVHKLIIFSILFIIPAAAVLTYLAHVDGSWFNPSFFPRIFGIYPVEDYLWGFLYTYWIIAAYEYFFDRPRRYSFPRRFRPMIAFLLLLAAVFSLVAYVAAIPSIPYFYALLVSAFMLLISWTFLAYHQLLILKVVKMEIFFLLPSILLEYVAQIHHSWWFPGINFVGYVQSLGITIPLEEFLWIFFAVPAWVVYYELLADDER